MESQEKNTEIKSPTVLRSDDDFGKLDTVSNKLQVGDRPLQEWLDVVFDFISKTPAKIASFFSDYQKPLLVLLLIVGSLAAVYITLAVLDAINDLPLLGSILELVGLAYGGWFIWRYLLKASSRDELLQEFESLKSQVIGSQSEDN